MYAPILGKNQLVWPHIFAFLILEPQILGGQERFSQHILLIWKALIAASYSQYACDFFICRFLIYGTRPMQYRSNKFNIL